MKKSHMLLLGILIFICGIFIGIYGEKIINGHSKIISLDSIKGISQKEVHNILGDSLNELSGFWGEGYFIDNGTKVIVYYDSDGNIDVVTIFDKNDNRTCMKALTFTTRVMGIIRWSVTMASPVT